MSWATVALPSTTARPPEPVPDLRARAGFGGVDGPLAEPGAVFRMQEVEPCSRARRHLVGRHTDQFGERLRPALERAVRPGHHARQLRHALSAAQAGFAFAQGLLFGDPFPDVARYRCDQPAIAGAQDMARGLER